MTNGTARRSWQTAMAVALLVAAAVVIVPSFYKHFFRRHLELPIGCDEFGYLYLAKGISLGRPFVTPTARPFDPALTKALVSSAFPFRSYQHMIAPHAYHLDPFRHKVINQYPPGTSLLLSLLPFDSAKRGAPPLFALFIMIFVVLAVLLREGRITLFEAGLATLVMLLFLEVDPFRATFGDVNSIAPTFGLLFGAGYLLDKKPGASLLFLGLSTVFRVVNAVLALPLIVVFAVHSSLPSPLSKTTWVRAVKGGLLFLAGGLWIYAGYVWILLGSPFRPTYSYIDQAFTLKGLVPNIGYYFSFSQPWFICHLVLLTVVVFMAILRKCPWTWAALAIGLTGLNYAYYLIHQVTIPYYPYGSATILLGLVLSLLAAQVRRFRPAWLVPAAAAFILLILVRSTTHKFPRQDFHALFQDRIRPYTDAFAKYDVVWAELRSGTVEYATGKAGFRYAWGPEQQRETIMRWLRGHGFKQAIWISDLPSSREAVEAELTRARIGFQTITNTALGTILEISPKKFLKKTKTKHPGRGREAPRRPAGL